MVCICGDDGWNAHPAGLHHQPRRGIEAIVTFLVDATCVDFHYETFLSNEVEGFQGQFTVPCLVLMEIPVTVMHLDLVEVGDDVELLVFNHFVRLVEKATYRTADVAIKELLQTFIVNLPFRAVDEPNVIGKRSLSLSKDAKGRLL